jgi:hypothetical protein
MVLRLIDKAQTQIVIFPYINNLQKEYFTLGLVSSLNNLQNSEMNFHENMTLRCRKPS